MIYPIAILAIENDEDRLFMQRLYEAYHQIMRREARRILRREDEADDMVNDAFLALINHIETLHSIAPDKLRAYHVSTIRNICFDFLRKQNSRRKYVFFDGEEALIMAQSGDPDVDDRLIREAEMEQLTRALRKLPEQKMHLLEMKYYQQLPDGEIAEILGIKAGSVRQALIDARRRVAELIAKENSL